jgi:hypothetical protein
MAMAANESKQKIDFLCNSILAGGPLNPTESLSLDEFAALYHKVSEQTGVKHRIDIVLQSDRALVQFTGLTPGHQIVYIVSEHRLTQQDFSRIVHKPVFHGDILPVSFRQRIKEEHKNLLVSFGFGLLFSLTLFALGNSVAADYASYLADPDGFPSVDRVVDFLVQINEMLLTSATLFLSIFLVFTVAQSSKLQEDTRLFDSGLLHKFERDDRLIAMVALTSLLLSLLNVVILGIPAAFGIARWQIAGRYMLTLNMLSLIIPALTGLSIATLAFCFLALLYYLKRTMLITNRDMSGKVLKLARRATAQQEPQIGEKQC